MSGTIVNKEHKHTQDSETRDVSFRCAAEGNTHEQTSFHISHIDSVHHQYVPCRDSNSYLITSTSYL